MNPLEGNPLASRRDVARAARDLFEPLVDHFSPGNARVKPGATSALFPDSEAQLEGFARPLWGIAPLAAGDLEFDHWGRLRDGLANGTDPEHEEYWGEMPEISQMAVEMAPIGVALALAPEKLWTPLDGAARENVVDWLVQTNDVEFGASNWRFFRVLANLGLHEVGATHDWQQVQADLDVLAKSYHGDGWYSDGPDGHFDYYSAWEMQVDGLVYAAIAGDDSGRGARIRRHAAAFADDFAHWFTADGAALPYGRSLTYRFAQGSFWGALAFADVEPDGFPWGAVKRAWLQHLRWWRDQAVFTDGGVLSLGYAYPTLKMTEAYNSPSSPYWGMKFFLPLALPASHPFWTADEEAVPERDTERAFDHAEMVVARDRAADHVVAHPAGAEHTHHAEKYNKFAYSTAFGFAVPSGAAGLTSRGIDGTLAFAADDGHYRTRHDVQESRVADGVAFSRWSPFDGVDVASWVVPGAPWHVRVHRVETDRAVESAEGGFSVPAGDPAEFPRTGRRENEAVADAGTALIRSSAGSSGIRGATNDRAGDVVSQDPNTNLRHPRTCVPVLRSEQDPGEHVFATTVLGAPEASRGSWDDPPAVDVSFSDVYIERPDGETAIEFDDW